MARYSILLKVYSYQKYQCRFSMRITFAEFQVLSTTVFSLDTLSCKILATSLQQYVLDSTVGVFFCQKNYS